MADIFDEVSEDLRKDQYKQIWSKYKKYIISFIVIFIASISVFKLIKFYQEKKKMKLLLFILMAFKRLKITTMKMLKQYLRK